MEKFQRRIKFAGDIRPVLKRIALDYKLGAYKTHRVIPVGYEDYNLALTTEKGKYFVKIFASYRSKTNCERYIEIIRQALRRGVGHPKLYKSPKGFLHSLDFDKVALRLCVMEHIGGDSLYAFGGNLGRKKEKFLIKQAALINRIKLKPKFVYDSWAVSNFLKEYRKKRKYLGDASKKILDKLAKEFSKLRLAALPHCLVHGDIIKTNVLRDKAGKLFIIDFSVSNYYPRIQELAVLLCSCLFDEKNPERIARQRDFAMREYQRYIRLTGKEIKAFPIFCDVAHAMHILQATYEKEVLHNNSQENAYWVRLGKIGLGIKKSAFKLRR